MRESSRAHWKATTLGAEFDWSSGGTPKSTEPSYYDGGIPWAVIGDLNDGPIETTARTISEAGLRSSAAKWAEEGSVLVAMYGSIGKLGIATQRLTTNQAIAFTKPKSCSAKYLFWYLLFSRPRLITLGKGGTQSNISQAVIKAFPFVLPPAHEQEVIVDGIEKQLTRLDAGVAALRRVQANLKRYRAAVLKAACEGRLVPTEAELARKEGRTFETGEALLARIVAGRRQLPQGRGAFAEPGAATAPVCASLPEGWTWTTIGACFRVVVGATPSRGQPSYWGGAIPWVSSGEVSFSPVTTTRETITQAGLENSSTKINPSGSVLVGMIGEGRTRGQVAILRIAACNNQNSAAIWVPGTEVPPEYVFYWLWSQYEATRRTSSGNNQPALNKSRVEAIPVPLPPLAEQTRIIAEVARRLSVVDALDAVVSANLQRAVGLRRSVLRRAFVSPHEGSVAISEARS